jgi:hypothetical protein
MLKAVLALLCRVLVATRFADDNADPFHLLAPNIFAVLITCLPLGVGGAVAGRQSNSPNSEKPRYQARGFVRSGATGD